MTSTPSCPSELPRPIPGGAERKETPRRLKPRAIRTFE